MIPRPFRDGSYGVLTLGFIAVAAWVHFAAGFTFPVPWPDEAVFVRQAISFQQHNTLLTPSLSESRTILWMPPGYMMIMGLLFKIAGSSLLSARLFSFITASASFAVLIIIFRNHPARFHILVLIGLFFLSRTFVIMGNVARMEPLLILGVVTALALFTSRRRNAALSMLLLLPLVHPNGVYFLASGVVFIALQELYLKEEIRGGKTDKALIGIALLLLAAYALFALLHWNDFVRDMSYQFVRKSKRNLIAPLMAPGTIVFLSFAFVATGFALVRKAGSLVVLGLFAISFWCINIIGQEMWYEVFQACAVLLLMLLLMQLLNPGQKTIVYTLLVLVAIYIGRQVGMIESLRGYPHSMRWYSMGLPGQVDYFNAEDAAKIKTLLQTHQRENAPVRAMIYPSADALLLQEMEGPLLKSLYVAPDTLVFPAQRYELYLVHLSRYAPIGWDWSYLPWVLEDAGIDTAGSRNLLFERDGTEQWFYRSVKPGPDSLHGSPVVMTR
jgi:hypothetical protein